MGIHFSNINFEITSSCNLNCKYCYNHWKANNTKAPATSYKKSIKTLKHLFSLATIETITLTGGEPFTSERFEEVVLFVRLQNKKVNIISNGNACDDLQLKRMIDMGVQLFEIPFHSKYAEVHDAMTNKNGSWSKSLHTIKTIIINKGYVVPVIILTKYNYQHIEETLAELYQMGIQRILVNRFNIGGNGIVENTNLQIKTNELQDTFTKMNQFAKDFNMQISSGVCTPYCILNPNEFKNITFGSCPTNILQKPLTLDIEGNIRICNHSPVALGNIFINKLEEILYTENAEKWQSIQPTFCVECEWLDNCKGGCRAASQQLGNTLYDVDPILNIS